MSSKLIIVICAILAGCGASPEDVAPMSDLSTGGGASIVQDAATNGTGGGSAASTTEATGGESSLSTTLPTAPTGGNMGTGGASSVKSTGGSNSTGGNIATGGASSNAPACVLVVTYPYVTMGTYCGCHCGDGYMAGFYQLPAGCTPGASGDCNTVVQGTNDYTMFIGFNDFASCSSYLHSSELDPQNTLKLKGCIGR